MTKIMANQYVEKGNFKKIMDLLKHMGKKVKLEVPKEKSSKIVWTVEGVMNENMDQKMFDSLKKGDKVGVTFGSGIRRDNKVTLLVKSKSKSKKYNLEKINCVNVANPGGMKYTIYNRQGKFSLAQGDMATHGAEFVKESVEEKRDAGKSATGYDIYHDTYSAAMQHAYAHAKKKHGVTVRSSEIDDKVALGPRKPSNGKTVSHILKTDKKQNLHVQVYNTGRKYELNMYVESVELDEGSREADIKKTISIMKKYPKNKNKSFKELRKGAIDYLDQYKKEENELMDKTDFEKVAYYVKAINDTRWPSGVVNEEKFSFIVRDKDGKIAGGSSSEREAKMMASRIKGKVQPLKKPISNKQLDNMKVMGESVELDEAIDYFKVSKELSDYAKKNGGPDKREFEKAAAYVREIGRNSAVSVQDKAGKGLNILFKNADTDVRDRLQMILTKGGFKVKGGYVMRESTAAYGKSLSDIRNKRKMAAIKPKDRDTLKKLADLMKRANEDAVEEKYKKPTQAEIDADRKKDKKPKDSSDRYRNMKKKMYGNAMENESVELDESEFTIKVPKGGIRGKDYVTKVSGKDQKSVVAKWRKENPKFKNDTIDVQQLATLKKKGDKYSFSKESVEEGKWFVRQSAKPNKTGTYQGKQYDDGKKAIAQARKDWKLTPDEHMSAKMMKEAIEEGLDARQIALLKKNYASIDRIDPTGPAYKKAQGMIAGLDKDMQMDLAKAKVKFLSQIAAAELRKQHGVKLKAKDYMENTFSELRNK